MSTYGRYSPYLAVVFLSVYLVNLAYMKLLTDGLVDPVSGFQGLGPVQQVIVLLLMSIFFVAFVIDRSERVAA